jgi:hypothetical protein
VNAKISTAKDRNVDQNVCRRGPAKGRRARFTAFVSGPLFLFAVALSVILSDSERLTICGGVDDDVEGLSLCLLPTGAIKDLSKQHAKAFKRSVSEPMGSKATARLSVTTRSPVGPHDRNLPLKRLPSAERRAPKTPPTDPD